MNQITANNTLEAFYLNYSSMFQILNQQELESGNNNYFILLEVRLYNFQ